MVSLFAERALAFGCRAAAPTDSTISRRLDRRNFRRLEFLVDSAVRGARARH
jgi:hypothetical protein